MRAGICSIQQALTVEALATVKQAVSLARRRGHAQVTPLHVASSMLASSTGLLRRACLQSHSHPLQCKALELCFNVALNRLPASTPSPLLGPPHSPHPSLSNALVAAFKRAQAHQRRGSIENQQQPILALKIEIEQLVISILDDPSVSRVMREAGFSSMQIKSRVEQAVSVEACSQQAPNPDSSVNNPPAAKEVAHVTAAKPLSVHFATHSALEHASNEDVASVLDALLSKRRNVVIVGEGLSGPEAAVRGVIDKFERGLVPLELKSVQFISLPLFSLRNSSREEVEQKLVDLRGLVKSCIGRGIVFYLGDMQGVSEYWSSYVEQRRSYYCSSNLEYLVLELKKLVCGFGESNRRIWLMGIATFRTYMKCKSGHPSLESIWDLHPLTVPAGSLSLSLNLDSDLQADSKSNVLIDVEKSLTCCKDCTLNFDKDVQAIGSVEIKDSTNETSVSSSLPSWLQQYKNEKSRDSRHYKQEESVSVKSLCKKWNSFCNRAHQDPLHGKTLKFYSTPSSPTTSFSSPERNSSFPPSHLSWPTMIEFKQCPKEHQFWASDGPLVDPPKPDLLSNPNSSPNSASSSEVAEDMNDNNPSFKEFSPNNIKILSDALVTKVPWQREIIPEIVDTVLKCRSGIIEKNGGSRSERHKREETLMLFLGTDSNAKENISRELAKLVFGSQGNFISIGLSRFSDPVQEYGKKRPRDELGFSYLQRFGEAVNENPHRVFFLEDVDQFDYSSKLGIKRAVEGGKISVWGGETVSLQDAIVIFSCESLGPVSRRENKGLEQQEKDRKEKENDDYSEEKNPGSVSLDLNMAIHDEDEKGDNEIRMILDCVDRKIIFKTVQEQL
ncbi:hypothetical protein CRG98_036602 [Punica granatum]|uniref:Clp R domain-containing protein n=1 Tax=Punica granatum TaxID=22663 RepID=A0A2I0IGA6_PUNGR|nr:hypothetical protein CRG98_036602 [Punica granatum]